MYCLPIYVVCVSSHFWTVAKQIWVWTILTKTWDSSKVPLREASPLQNGWIFGKVPKGGDGRVISNPKIYVADFCHFKGVLRSWILEKIHNMIFRKWGGGVNGRLELFQKFIRFWRDRLPLPPPTPPSASERGRGWKTSTYKVHLRRIEAGHSKDDVLGDGAGRLVSMHGLRHLQVEIAAFAEDWLFSTTLCSQMWRMQH